MLITQTQVSAAISSTVGKLHLLSLTRHHPKPTNATVITFTTLLFFAGYILQQQTVTSLRGAIRPRLQALKALPQAQVQPATTTVGVAFGDAGIPLKLSVNSDEAGTMSSGETRDLEDEDDRLTTEESEAEEGSIGHGSGRVVSLDEWIYSDETEGQKRIREGLGVLDRRA